MHVQSQAPDGGFWGWDDPSQIPQDHRRLTDGEIEARLNPPKTPEQEREEWKRHRADAVARISVTTASGNTFDGDEISQGRMARAIIGLQAAPVGTTVTWVLADNAIVQVGLDELTEALTLAGLEQTRLWVLPA